jgi:hypothetical protein
MNKKWQGTNEEIAQSKIINCINKMHIINLGKYPNKV